MAAQMTPPYPTSLPADSHSWEEADRILPEIAAVRRPLEAMDSKISDLTVASIRADIAGFRETVTDLDLHDGRRPGFGIARPRGRVEVFASKGN
ncbi:hypothetical protein NDU88_003049 [Pleurodeles waltl]|uniref:Uncharacterized protein n=1 Tax=Pleurodeles waltl TaxID=8319 RepID=A0AAV7UXW6_PLEWA|nr:hypothetical protein NDU88_003049 [Pleurodeles waltl]